MNTLKQWVIASLAIGMTLSLAACTKGCKDSDATNPATPSASTESMPAAPSGASGTTTIIPVTTDAQTASVDLNVDEKGLSKATVAMKTSKGTIKFKLYAKDAPNTVKRFVELVQSKFYNGQSFHRIIPGFIVQTGDPRSKNKNDPEIGHVNASLPKIKAEFNGRRHTRGTVALARVTSDPDSADSQFYVTLNSFSHLDEKYTVFGQIIDFGEKVGDKDVLDRITLWDDLVEMHIE